MNTAFDGALRKTERAKRHLLELQAAIPDATFKQYVKFVTRVDPESQKFQLNLIGRTDVTSDLALIVGDAIHNLRSALDHVAVALTVQPIGNGNLKNTSFPTGIDKALFLEARDGKMKGAPPDALRMVAELEPYDGGKHSIRALHELDIRDKHKLLVPVVSRIRIDRLDVSFGGETKSLGTKDFRTYDDGQAIVALFEFPGAGLHDLQYNGLLKASFDIVFEQGQPLAGEPIVETLREISNAIEGFIHACNSHFS